MSRLWPRIERPIATALLAELEARTPDEIRATSALSHPAVTYASTGGVRVNTSDLERVRCAIVETAEAHGFPGAGDTIAFDRAMAARCSSSNVAMPLLRCTSSTMNATSASSRPGHFS